MKKISTLFALAAFAALACISASFAAAEKPYNFIVISWDGTQRAHLDELIKEGKLVNLSKLTAEGKRLDLEITTHQTDTKAGHTQMLTGYKPETTGVYNNAKFGPIPEGYSIFEKLESNLGSDNIVTIALTGKSAHVGSMPAGPCPKKGKKGKKVKKNANTKQCPAQPWNIVKKSLDVWDGDKQRDASEVGPLALGYLDKYAAKRFFFFLHFSDPDHAGHKHSENSAEYSQGIITCDQWLGKMREKLTALGIADRTLIYVTTDHGFDEGKNSHKDAPHIWLVTNDTGIAATTGDQMDITPTLLKRAEVPEGNSLPALPGKPLF